MGKVAVERKLSYLKLADLVEMKTYGSIGYSVGYIVDPSKVPVKEGEEVKGYCCIRWIDGDLKTQGWISIATKLKDEVHTLDNFLTLITDKTRQNFYREKYPFINSISGTKNILSNDFPTQKQ